VYGSRISGAPLTRCAASGTRRLHSIRRKLFAIGGTTARIAVTRLFAARNLSAAANFTSTTGTQENAMRHALAALMLLALVLPARAEEQKPNTTDIEVGSGLVCDTREQVQRYVELFRGDAVKAAEEVNKEVGKNEACAFGTVAFVRGADVARVRDNEDKPVKIAEIMVIGIGTTGGLMQIEPVRWFTLFAVEEITI
jgi:hypothetical protein